MLITGDVAGHYEILEKLGEGGMGAVYKARDKRLDRLVALKLLPTDKVSDEERIRRFTQEARAASALNHPNIVTIYEIASEDSARFIAMEYVPGKPLDELILRKGMRLNEALKIAIQIADALTAAAAAGIVHRDLKPANVMVSDSGFVKVLDFGLAKLAEPSDSEQTAALTVEEERPRTREGTVLGTSSYMSPEQAEGKPLDPRSDIFSFGAVLYEMITGQRAFRGETSMSRLSATLREEPKPASQISADLPGELDRVIARCLRKDRERRFQQMADVRIALLELKEESESGKLAVSELPRRSRRRTWLWAGLADALVIAAAALAIRLRSPSPGPAPRVVPFTSYTGYQGEPAFSPDGNEIAFVWAENMQDHHHIYIKVNGTDTPLRLTSTDKDDGSPAWAPEGQSIAFVRKMSDTANAICTIAPLGGRERRIAEIGGPLTEGPLAGGPVAETDIDRVAPGLSWSADGKWLVTSRRPSPGSPARILAVSADTGAVRVMDFGGSVDEFWPALSPDSHTLAFCRFRGEIGTEIYTARLSDDLRPNGSQRRLDAHGRWNSWPAWTLDGTEVVFAILGDSPGTARLWRAPANGSSPARPIEGIGEGSSAPAVASHKNRLAFQHAFAGLNVWQIPTLGAPASARPRVLIASTRPDLVRPNAFSAVGRKIVFESERSGSYSIWIANADELLSSARRMLPGRDLFTEIWSHSRLCGVIGEVVV